MSTIDRIRTESHRDPDQLERELDAQRQRVASLVGQLEDRLSPGELMGKALGAGKDGGKEFAASLSHSVRANPVPALLTATGLLWLYAERDRPVQDDIYATDADHEGVRDKLSGKAGHAKELARRRAQEARIGFDHMLDENPIALGALGVAAGAMLGALLPSTESEDRWLGEVRDRAAEDLRHGARDATRADGGGARAH